MQKSRSILISSFALSILVSQSVLGQYVWLNEKGVKQYSDSPPPKSVPREKIIKSPGNAPKATEVATVSERNESNKLEKPATIASKNEDFNKRKVAREEAEKKAESDKQQAEDKEKNCTRAKAYKQSLDEGQLLMTRDKNGERTVLDESQRTKEMADVKRVLAECK
ncbi:DUF4124 domain-containing protein [Undibacterium fentianense]|uniref:DUF4124 domain-containing protein n=1 Tax=Undibacterium fentianense TaxID=2828728 RepID=A0A941IB42_9BURK|nr:DUF4124 domain-containing protein [Undibacterium fentianense]MBR7798619.1 DUF4124 domain-containing protein [Undibacterium fentianense]